ncbi:MAG: IS66 family insertion sequence element accessory protein TnpA [Cyclobacteriaceae bacterium]
MFSLCREWEESGETRESFCKRHQINAGKFSYWRSQFLAEEKPQEDDFLAVTPAVDSGKVLNIDQPCSLIERARQ